MAILNINSGDVPVGRFEFVVQLALIAGLCAGAAWLWPLDLLGGPMSAITFPEVLRALSAPGLVLAAAAWLYLLVKLRPRGAEPAPADELSAVEPRDKTPPHLGTPGYRGH